MPIHEYHCEPCVHSFESLIRSASDVPRCPKCGSLDVTKLLSVPAAAQTGGRSSDLPICHDTGGPVMRGCGAGACGMCAPD
jgi:putative FmdB family regulatory protein